MVKIQTKQMIDVSDWDSLVTKTYGRPYSFQQQNGCQGRGTFPITIPSTYTDDYENDTIPEKVNGNEMGVSFSAWLARDPKQKLLGQKASYELDLFWERNFYPDVHTVANDLHAKGLLPAGDYLINIDW